MEEIPKMEPIIPTSAGRLCSGTTVVSKTMDPENTPALPIPATARPTINAFEFGAAPHTAEPTSKSPMAVR